MAQGFIPFNTASNGQNGASAMTVFIIYQSDARRCANGVGAAETQDMRSGLL